MKAGKYKNVCAAAVFSLLQLVFLYSHFSAAGCVCAAMVLLYNCVLAIRASEESLVSSQIGSYLGALLAGFLSVYYFSVGSHQEKPIVKLNPGAWTGMILMALVPLALYFVTKNSGKNSGFSFTVKYLLLWGASINIAYLFIQWTDWSVVLSMAVFLLLFIVMDRIGIQGAKQSTHTFLWAAIILYLFDSIAYLAPQISISIISSIRNFQCRSPFPWYDTVIVSAVLAVGMVVTSSCDYHFNSADAAKHSADSRLYLVMLADVLWAVIAELVYTKDTPLFFFAMFLLNIFAFFGPGKDSTLQFFKVKLHTKDVSFAVAAAAVFMLQAALYYGCILPCLFFILSAIGACFLRKSEGWLYWQYLITAFAVLSDILVSLWFHVLVSYVAIAFIFVIATAVLGTLHLQNPLHRLSYLKWKRITVIGAVVWMLAAGCRFGTACHFKTVSQDSVSPANSIVVSLNARGTKNTVVQCSYCWEGGKKKELSLNDGSHSILPARNGELCVTVMDRYGVESTVYRWFHDYRTAVPYQCGKLKGSL